MFIPLCTDFEVKCPDCVFCVSDSSVDISSLDIQVNAVATVLKAFFADLTDPLVPLSLYHELIEASGKILNLISQCPYLTLVYANQT